MSYSKFTDAFLQDAALGVELLGHRLVRIQIWYLLPKIFPKWLLLINF